MSDFKQIDVQQVFGMVEAEAAAVVDIRDPDSFQEGHIRGALHLNDQNIKDFLAAADRSRPLICYCYHGISSQSAAGFFAQQGFKEVYSMIGGFEEWRHNFKDNIVIGH